MKTMTVTAIFALLVSIPMVLRKYRTRLQPIRTNQFPRFSSEEKLYDIDDFVS